MILDTRDIYGAISALAAAQDLTARGHHESALDDARRAKELLDRALVRAEAGIKPGWMRP